MKQLNAIAICSGGGSSSLGFNQAGFKHVLAIDNDKHAAETYRRNFPDVPVEEWDLFEKSGIDILNRVNLDVGELDLLHLEPPCQSISMAGKRNMDDTRNNLLLDVTPALILDILPKFFVIENVAGLIQGKYLPMYFKLTDRLNILPYVWDFRILNALDFSTPTYRNRFVVIGVRDDIANHVSFPCATTINKEALRINQVAPHIKWVYSGYNFPERKKKSANSFMNTITKTRNIMVQTVEGDKRFLNYEELLLFNGLPPTWKIGGSLIQQWARIGNAVPPPLTKAIGKKLVKEYFKNHLSKNC